MPETPQTSRKDLTPDWFVQGILTRIGDAFDRLLGRGWKPSSSLATSELIERLKALLDSEVKENETRGKFVPHNIKLKMQWDKFSTDADGALKTLENELLAAAVDHINDRRYFTFAPLSIEVKPDYFTQGVKLYASFDKFDKDNREAEMNVSIPGMQLSEIVPDPAEPETARVLVRFDANGETIVRDLELVKGRRLSVGRTKENGLTIDDPSVSKTHASLLLNESGKLVVADTGSTNGTFVNDSRISYGKAIELNESDGLKFGAVDVAFEFAAKPEPEPDTAPAVTEKYTVGEFEFTSKIDTTGKDEKAVETAGGPQVAAEIDEAEVKSNVQ